MVLEAYMLTSSVVNISVCLIVQSLLLEVPKHFTKSINIIFLLSCIRLSLLKGI